MADEHKTVGRWGPRIRVTDEPRSRAGDDEPPIAYFYDGKSITPWNKRGREAEFFTGFGQTAGLLRPGKLTHTDWDYARAVIQSEYAFRCVEAVAGDIAGIKHGVRSRKTKEDLPKHPLLLALTWARVRYKQNIIPSWQKSLRVFGEAYIEPCSNDFRDPFTGKLLYNGARWLNPIAVEPVIIYGQLQRFDYTAGGITQYAPNELVYDKVDSMLDDLRGQSLIGVALDAINIDKEVKRYTLDMFLKDMRMAGILTGREGSNVSQGELDTALEVLKQKKDARLIALAPALVWQQVQHAFDDSQLKVGEDVRRRITTALGIPMSTAGAWDDAKYQSAPEQRRFYYESVVFRECERHATFINDVLLPFYDDTGEAEWYYDTDAVSALMEDKAAKTVMFNSRLASGGITLNEYREALGHEPDPAGDVYYIPSNMIAVPKAQLAAFVQQQAQQLAARPTVGVPALPAPLAVNAAPPALPAPGSKDACLMLKIGADPDLIALQTRLKQLLAGLEVKWNAPDEFHVTLIDAPSAADTQIEQLKAALDSLSWPDDMALKVGSLRSFDNVGEHAVHFRVSKTSDLAELQESAYELFAEVGIGMSQHHQPAAFKPHITMGYAPQAFPRTRFDGGIRVKPTALELWYGDAVVYTRDFVTEADAPTDEAAEDAAADPTVKALPAIPACVVHPAQETAEEELTAWEKAVKNRGARKALDFQNYRIRDEIAEAIRFALREAGDDTAAVKAVFDRAREVVAYKAIQATRLDFEDGFASIWQAALGGNLTRRRWATLTRSLISQYCNKAYRDGLADGGVDEEPDESEQDEINTHISAQSEYVTGLADRLFVDEVAFSPEFADQRAEMWWKKSVQPMYTAGLASAKGNQLMEFAGDDGGESCNTCIRLKGQRHRLKDWRRKRLVPGEDTDNFECGGYHCNHKLVAMAGAARGNW